MPKPAHSSILKIGVGNDQNQQKEVQHDPNQGSDLHTKPEQILRRRASVTIGELERSSQFYFRFSRPEWGRENDLNENLARVEQAYRRRRPIFGRDILTESTAIRERIGYLPQQPRFIETMTARENLQFAARFFFRGPQAAVDARCEEMLELVGLAAKADRPIKGFSGGEKQRLGIALAQVNYPDLLILDEPASALDPLGRQEVLAVMERLRKHATIFYSTHILDDVQRVSDTVAILNRGKLVASGPIEQIVSGKNGVVYTLTTEGSAQKIERRLALMDCVSHASAIHANGRTTWQISVRDEQAAKARLLREVLEDPQVTVTEFSRKKYELEEVFMDIVKGGGDGGQS